MNLQVIGIKKRDDKWDQMAAAADACIEAGIPVPETVRDFLDSHPHPDFGAFSDMELRRLGVTKRPTNKPPHAPASIEIDLTKLPEGVTTLLVSTYY